MMGVLHVHTKFSHDGELIVEQIAQICRRKNYRFILITEHSQDLSEELFKTLCEECNRCSGDDLLIVPGLEYEGLDGIHMLVVGLDRFLPVDMSLEEIATLSRAQGGIVLIAHPKRNGYYISDGLIELIDGIEIWNAKLDGSFAPNFRSLMRLQSIRNNHPNIFGYAGLDWHWSSQKTEVSMAVNIEELDKVKLLNCLKNGNFCIRKGNAQIESMGENNYILLAKYLLYNNIYNVIVYIGRIVIKICMKNKRSEHVVLVLKNIFRRYLH